MTNAVREEKRLGLVLAKDKMRNPNRFSIILKKETEMFLQSFFDLEPDTLAISVSVCNDSSFDFVIKGKAKRILPCTNI